MSDKINPHVKHAAFVGIKAFHGFKNAQGSARFAARVPVVGHALGVAVLIGGTIAGAVSGFNDYDG